jgi:hypothetical protein
VEFLSAKPGNHNALTDACMQAEMFEKVWRTSGEEAE